MSVNMLASTLKYFPDLGGGGGQGLNFMHENLPPGYIMKTTNHNM